jgi:hypothetical protein
MAATSTIKLLETKTLVSAAASIEFTSIPQDGTDLHALVSTTSSGVFDSLLVRFNSDTGNNYSWRRLFGSGSGAPATDSSTSTNGLLGPAITTATTTDFGNTSMYVPNYSGSTSKSVFFDGVTEANTTTSFQSLLAGIYTPTTAITSITFRSFNANNLSIGTSISLYKITKGSDGIVTTS